MIRRAIVMTALIGSLLGIGAAPAAADTCVRVPGSYQIVFCLD